MKSLAALTTALIILTVPARADATTSGILTLTTYNIHSGIPDGFSNATYHPALSDLQNIADVLTTAGADIIALQEVRNLWSMSTPGKMEYSPLNMSLFLSHLMKMNYAFGSTLDSSKGRPGNRDYIEWGNSTQWASNGAPHGEYGNSLLTRLDIMPPTIIKLPRGDAEALKNMDEPRNAVRVQLLEQVPTLGSVVTYTTHFQHNNGKTREAQMKELLRVAKADATTATVFLMGDFNHHPHPGEPNLLALVKDAGFHDLAAEFAQQSATQPQPTIIHNESKRRIDYIFCSRPVTIKGVTVLDTPVSDHLPLTVTISLK